MSNKKVLTLDNLVVVSIIFLLLVWITSPDVKAAEKAKPTISDKTINKKRIDLVENSILEAKR